MDPEVIEAMAIEAVTAAEASRPEGDAGLGVPIEAWSDDRRLGVGDRLGLFARVVDAVDLDHRRGRIHGALEPDRIVVNDDGEPRVIGPGLADRVEPTPEYASPEQVLGEPITTAVDIYALGVILYRLLTGRGPYRLRSGDRDEVDPAICEQAPERPSRAVVPRHREESDPDPSSVASTRGTTPAGLSRALAGDLDAIVLMAMRKEPDRRYPTAGQLADDLRAHLDGRPVRARGDSALYRVATFARRHAAAVAVVMLLIAAMAAGVAGVSWGLVRARHDRDRARSMARDARAAIDRTADRVLDEPMLDQPGMQGLRLEFLRDARESYERFLDGTVNDPSTRADRASARTRLARIVAATDPPAAADAPYRRAIEAWEAMLAAAPDVPEYQEGLASALEGRASVLLKRGGQLDEAGDACRRALGRIDAALVADPRSTRRRRLRAAILRDAAEVQSRSGRADEAIASLGRAIEDASKLVEEDPTAIEPRDLLAVACAQLGRILDRQPGGLGPAIAAYHRAVEVGEWIARDRPELAGPSHRLGLALIDLGLAQQLAGKLDSALASGRRAVAVLEGLDRRYPEAPDYREGLARAYNRLGALHRVRREPFESLAMAEKARPMLERLVADHPDDAVARVDLARTYSNIGRVHRQDGEPAEALQAFRRAVDLLEGLVDLQSADGYDLAANLSLCIPLIGAKPGTQGADDDEVVDPGDRRRRGLYGDRAIEVLRKAVRGGAATAETLQDDPDLAAIRRRDDFRQLVEGLQKPDAK